MWDISSMQTGCASEHYAIYIRNLSKYRVMEQNFHRYQGLTLSSFSFTRKKVLVICYTITNITILFKRLTWIIQLTNPPLLSSGILNGNLGTILVWPNYFEPVPATCQVHSSRSWNEEQSQDLAVRHGMHNWSCDFSGVSQHTLHSEFF